ncbi:MAG: folylpolyglutamate synthase/dihydrofolate synthase family protein [Candidatus Saccharimonadales bacterium]
MASCTIVDMLMQNFQDVRTMLAKYVPKSRSERGAYTLERIEKLMIALGNPQNKYKVIHIAGTSGKSSTSYYTASLLRQAGLKVGLSVSPHINEINERAQINLLPLEEKQYCSEFSLYMDIVTKLPLKLTYFELLVGFAYWEFERVGVDYAVIEVGLGGLLDGTNVVTSSNKLCVITDIGLDHTEVLGLTLPEITAQKGGIIHPYNVVIMYEQAPEIMQVIREICTQQHANLHEVWDLSNKELPHNLVLFQRRNWYLALSAYDLLSQRDSLPLLDEKQLAASSGIIIPARMETMVINGKTVIFDGAHNAQKMQSLARSIQHKYSKKKCAVLMALVQSKNFKLRTSLKEIIYIASHMIITSFITEQDTRKRSVNPLLVAQYCSELGFEEIEIINDAREAFNALLLRNEDVLLVTGSFYLLNHILPYARTLAT